MGNDHRSGLDLTDYQHFTGFDGDWRDSWWDEDFLGLVAGVLDLGRVRQALDLGCGVGHWGQRWAPYFHDSAELTGIDAEVAWLEGAAERAERRGIRARYQVADAMALPFDDASFDLVTCQTVLMHVADPGRAVSEALRVLRPGGLFLAAEPNNLADTAAELVRRPIAPWPVLRHLMELEYHCALGKRALGQGWPCVGEDLPELLRAAGYRDIQVRNNSQCAPITPPYVDAAPMLEMMRDALARGGAAYAGGTRANSQAMFLAGGGTAERFESLWQVARQRTETVLAAVEDGTAAGAGGHLHYLIWGWKPDPAAT
jgi:SAM-dependent methyltransferase